MKKYLIFLILLLCINYESKAGDIVFDKSKGKQPAKIILPEKYFEKNKHLFFINQDYLHLYSQIVEYDVNTKKIVKDIFSIEGDKNFIKEYSFDDKYIVWNVVREEDKVYADIYTYNIATGDLKKVVKNIICNEEEGLYPILLNTCNEKIVWVEQDFKNKQSKVNLLDLKTKKMKVIDSANFLENESMKIPIIFVEFKNNIVFYDKRVKGQKCKIVLYDINKESISKTYDVDEDITIHFTGAYNVENNFMALYAKSKEKGDLIYIYDFNKNKTYPITGFYENSYIYNNKLYTIGKEIFYVVQLEVSGAVKDHYFGEDYNLTKMNTEKYQYAIDIFPTTKYIALLKFDSVYGPDKIHFELINR